MIVTIIWSVALMVMVMMIAIIIFISWGAIPASVIVIIVLHYY